MEDQEDLLESFVLWLFVVVVMGYVDYGKIFLFDVIRKINVIEKEVGGII